MQIPRSPTPIYRLSPQPASDKPRIDTGEVAFHLGLALVATLPLGSLCLYLWLGVVPTLIVVGFWLIAIAATVYAMVNRPSLTTYRTSNTLRIPRAYSIPQEPLYRPKHTEP